MLRPSLALAARLGGSALFARFVTRLLAPLPTSLDRLRLLAADAVFEQGDYALALGLYDSTRGLRHGPRAQQMSDWIRFKQGDYARGWPVYPGTHFDPSGLRLGCADGRVYVSDSQRPNELVESLGLRPWRLGESCDGPLLVWFNFRSSLGGELLAAKLVLRLRRMAGLPMILACDPRLEGLLRAAFPDDIVLSRDTDLALLRGRCQRFVLARDILSMVVRTPDDLNRVGEEVLISPPRAIAHSGFRRIALSWKTTNSRQARFRNLPIRELASALSRNGLELHSAQHGVTEDERREWRRHPGDAIRFNTLNPAGTVDEFAAQLAGMDLVVTIDNTLLHVAGATGLPAIGLLSVPSYWAWPMEGESSRWYPSVRLLHQERPGDWSDVLSRLSKLLDFSPAGDTSLRR